MLIMLSDILYLLPLCSFRFPFNGDATVEDDDVGGQDHDDGADKENVGDGVGGRGRGSGSVWKS